MVFESKKNYRKADFTGDLLYRRMELQEMKIELTFTKINRRPVKTNRLPCEPTFQI
jgi:hypothetical protein